MNIMLRSQADAMSGENIDPVGQLLAIGRSAGYDPAKWPDYRAEYGIGPEQIDALIQLACDMEIHNGDPDGAAIWGPVHAWRALAQLRAEAAIAPLLTLLAALDDDDFVDIELPHVFGMIGAAALAPIASFIADPATSRSATITATMATARIGEQNPATRSDCIAILTRMLQPEAAVDADATGFVVGALLDLAAVEAIDDIRAAFRRDAIDVSIAGDEEDVEIALGLREERTTPRARTLVFPDLLPDDSEWNLDLPVIQPVRQGPKIGRNAPCPCGSGKKYKKCCLP